MTSEGEFRLFRNCKVPKLDGMVHRARDQEVPTVMEVALPNWLTVFRVSGLALGIDEVPYLDATISGGCGQVVASRMEGDTTNPILMALATHDEISAGDGPEFPGGIV